MNKVFIDGREISISQPPYIVAEMSANHNGDIQQAKNLITQASQTGVDAIKIQTYTADTLTINCDRDDFKIKGGLWDGYTLYELYQEAHTPFEWHKELFEHARGQGITCFSSPFDETAVDLLEDLNCPAYKIASFEAIDLPLIQYAASTKKPLVISTGLASLDEIGEAVEEAKQSGCTQLILLHCISAYPAPIQESNLATIRDLAKKFNVLTGLSDHSLGTTVSVAAVAMGACFIEKHFTLDRNIDGPDSSFSLTPDEFDILCQDSRDAWLAIGTPSYHRTASEDANAAFRRSIYVVKDIQQGEMLSKDNIRSIRPGYGLAPKFFNQCLGKMATQNLSRGTPLTWQHMQGTDHE
ncbi:MAG: pseudaminic acid synthase [Gammaproteobacteria bacterium]|nr:pseudaminic acid synthase [Gammaproteobacteria bacterium]